MKIYHGRCVVVETQDDVYVGELRDNLDGTLSVLTGFRGRPPIIDADDVWSIMPVELSDLVDA